jgi:hypothetical protein
MVRGCEHKGLAYICDRLSDSALSDSFLPLLIKIDNIPSDKDPIRSNASCHANPVLCAGIRLDWREIKKVN